MILFWKSLWKVAVSLRYGETNSTKRSFYIKITCYVTISDLISHRFFNINFVDVIISFQNLSVTSGHIYWHWSRKLDRKNLSIWSDDSRLNSSFENANITINIVVGWISGLKFLFLEILDMNSLQLRMSVGSKLLPTEGVSNPTTNIDYGDT